MSIKQVQSYIKVHAKQFLLCLYMGTIINIYLYTQLMPNEPNAAYHVLLFSLSIIVYIASYLLSILISKILNKINIIPQKNSPAKKSLLLFFLIAFIIIISASIIWFVAYFPGGFSADSINQYIQATTNTYNDWHPVLHTLLFFKLPLALFGTPQSIVLCQIILFSLIVAYAATTIYSIAGRNWSFVFLIAILINPIISDELMSPWKDVGFAILALLITTVTLKIYCNKGLWNKKLIYGILLGLILAFCTLFRHNGFLFTAPVTIFLYFFLKRKQWLILITSFLLAVFFIKIPLYSLLQVESPDKRTVEVVGLPLTVIANVAKYAPQSLDEETSNYLYEIAPAESWQNNYYTGDFNSIKFNNANLSPIEKLSPVQIFLLAAKTTIKSPTLSLLALFRLTHVVYGIGEVASYSVAPSIHPNNKANITYDGNQTLANIIDKYRDLHSHSILKYTSYCGFTILLMLTFILFKNSRKDWKKILLCTPILFYDFCTMILLSGPETRFFYINFLIYPVVIILASMHPTRQPKTTPAKEAPRSKQKPKVLPS